jgi:glycosyltransferase involved in cell wall biosynthesis
MTFAAPSLTSSTVGDPRDGMVGNQRPGTRDRVRDVRVLIVAFSARNALAQTLDQIVDALAPHLDIRAMVPTNYDGKLPPSRLFRIAFGMGKAAAILASINPVTHWKVVAALIRARPDVVHIFSGEGYLWAVSLVLAARLRRIPVVLTLHDPDPHPGNIFERLNAIVRRPVLALTDTVHLFSGRHLQRARQLAPRSRFEIIAHGSLAGPFLRHRRADVEREDLILCFGRIQHYKGIDILLRAMAALPETTRLAIAGPGALDDEAQGLCRALGSRVELHNTYLQDAEVAALMQRASVVVLPYRHATQSSVPAIAAAFGCKLVASALGHFTEEIPALGGTLVPPEDPDMLARALAQTMAGPPIEPKYSPTFDDLAGSFVSAYSTATQQTQLDRHAVKGHSR